MASVQTLAWPPNDRASAGCGQKCIPKYQSRAATPPQAYVMRIVLFSHTRVHISKFTTGFIFGTIELPAGFVRLATRDELRQRFTIARTVSIAAE